MFQTAVPTRTNWAFGARPTGPPATQRRSPQLQLELAIHAGSVIVTVHPLFFFPHSHTRLHAWEARCTLHCAQTGAQTGRAKRRRRCTPFLPMNAARLHLGPQQMIEFHSCVDTESVDWDLGSVSPTGAAAPPNVGVAIVFVQATLGSEAHHCTSRI